MSSLSQGEITLWLSKGNSQEILPELTPRVYDELHRIAVRHCRKERMDLTLQPTEVLHETFLRLFQSRARYANRAHFFAIWSRAMTQILVDHARRRGAQKRAGAWVRVPPEDEADAVFQDRHELLALEEAVARLRTFDPRLGWFAALRLNGFSTCEAGALVGRKPSTARKDWKIARTWLQRELQSAR